MPVEVLDCSDRVGISLARGFTPDLTVLQGLHLLRWGPWMKRTVICDSLGQAGPSL